jgi:hypothetical protein
MHSNSNVVTLLPILVTVKIREMLNTFKMRLSILLIIGTCWDVRTSIRISNISCSAVRQTRSIRDMIEVRSIRVHHFLLRNILLRNLKTMLLNCSNNPIGRDAPEIANPLSDV